MAATPKEKFDAAVRVIQSLPKNGTFQPSHELMLRFYGFYKQATLGPCKPPRPGFWDVVGKAKWDAWNALGKMPRSEAMVQYVDELKKIIEMMPQTPTVAGFIEKLGAFYELVDDSDIQRLPKINGDVANNNNPTIDMSCIVEKHLSKNPDENDHTTFQRNHNSCDVNDLNHTDFADLEAESISCSKISDSDDLLSEDEDFIFNNGDDVDTRLHGNTSILSDNVNNNEIVSVETNAISYHQETVQIIQLPVSSSTPLKVKKSNMNDNCTEEDVIDNTAVKTNGYPVSSDTDSDADEFCDTSDQVSPLISAKPKLSPKLIHSNHRKYETTAQIHRNDETAMPPLVTSIPNNSETQTNAVTNRGGGDQRPTHSRPSASGWTGYAAGSDQDLVSVGDSPQLSQALPLTTGSGGDGGRPPTQYTSVQVNVNEQITAALAQLQLDMNHVLTRLNTLETYALLQRQILAEEVERERLRTNNQPSWWPFNQLSSRTVVFIVVWPFVANWIMKILFKRRKPMR